MRLLHTPRISRLIAQVPGAGQDFELNQDVATVTPQQRRRYNGGETRTPMCFFRFLVISLLTSASIAPLAAQTKQEVKQLPRGCAYMRAPVLESRFPRPARKDGINVTRVVAPAQFLVHNLPSPAESLLSPMPLFAESPSGFIMVCGLHSENFSKAVF